MRYVVIHAVVSILMAAAAAFPAYANTDERSATAQTQTVLADGEIRKVDREAKKLTIRHGPLTNLDMPAMTMVFQVKDVSMLDKVKQGDKVDFIAEKTGSQFIVTHIESR